MHVFETLSEEKKDRKGLREVSVDEREYHWPLHLINRPFPQPLGISVAMATTFLVFHALQV